MTVLRNQRVYPLALKAVPLNVGIVAAYDFAAEDGSTATSNGKDHSGNNRHYTTIPPNALIVQTTNGKGRDTSNGGTLSQNTYQIAGAVSQGLDVGTGDFTIWKRIRTPTYTPTVMTAREIGRISDSAGEKLSFRIYEASDYAGWRHTFNISGTIVLNYNTANNPTIASGTLTDLHIVREAGTTRVYVDGVLVISTAQVYSLLTTTGAAKSIVGNYTTTEALVDAAYVDEVYWNRALSSADVTAQRTNPYSYYDSVSTPNTITISAPTAGQTAGTSITISGTYAGGDTPSAIEASFNGGAWATIAAAPTGGVYSGTLPGQANGTGTLSVRWVNFPAVVATVANLTVSNASIAFVAATDATRPLIVQNYRTFQADALDSASVQIKLAWTGTPTAIEYRWGGAWAVLDAAPAGGVTDKTIVLQGAQQHTLEVRFANATGVIASLVEVSVGDIYLVAGQSNHVGMATAYIQPVAPANNPDWKSKLCAKDGNWKPHVESDQTPFDDRTNALFAVQNNGNGILGSYFGALATRIMATGRPVAFVPCAVGSTSLGAWGVSDETTTLFGAALARAALVGNYKNVLWWQGEAEVGGSASKATLVSGYNALVNGWFTRTGKKWLICTINSAGGTGVNFQNVFDALVEVGSTNSNCIGYANLDGAFTSGTHYSTGAEINEIATRVFAGLNNAPVSVLAGWTEGVETISLAGASVPLGIDLSAAWTEGSEVIAITGAAIASGIALAATWVEGSEFFAATGIVAPAPVTASLVWAEGTETFAAVGTVAGSSAVNAAAAWTESAEGFSATLDIETFFARAPSGAGYRPRSQARQSRPPNIQGYDR